MFWSNNSPSINRAEADVSKRLARLDRDDYQVFNNVMLLSTDIAQTVVTQIDHIIVSRYGIFCLETKSHCGWIFGSTSDRYWTQVIYKNRYRMYSPYRQNYGHIKAVEKAIGWIRLKDTIKSLVVFPTADKIKVNGTSYIGGVGKIMDIIKSYQEVIYSEAEFHEIVQMLESARITKPYVFEFHKQEVAELMNSYSYSEE
jgi:hypothetical protein